MFVHQQIFFLRMKQANLIYKYNHDVCSFVIAARDSFSKSLTDHSTFKSSTQTCKWPKKTWSFQNSLRKDPVTDDKLILLSAAPSFKFWVDAKTDNLQIHVATEFMVKHCVHDRFTPQKSVKFLQILYLIRLYQLACRDSPESRLYNIYTEKCVVQFMSTEKSTWCIFSVWCVLYNSTSETIMCFAVSSFMPHKTEEKDQYKVQEFFDTFYFKSSLSL